MQIAAKRYFILSTLQAVVGAVIAAVVGYLYLTNPSVLRDGATVVIGGLGATTLLYYGSVHQILKNKQPKLSAIILSLVSAFNITFIIAITGGNSDGQLC